MNGLRKLKEKMASLKFLLEIYFIGSWIHVNDMTIFPFPYVVFVEGVLRKYEERSKLKQLKDQTNTYDLPSI